MCIIVYRPANHELTMDLLEACQQENHDGWGIMYSDQGRVMVMNGMDLESFKSAYNSIEPDMEIAIHFRWKTHGNIDLINTHPYPVLNLEENGEDLWVMHNGIIDVKETRQGMSDTWHWVKHVARPILKNNPDGIFDPDIVDILEATVTHSRLLFLNGNGKFVFLNQKMWTEEKGCIWSTRPPTQTQKWNPSHKYVYGKGWIYGPGWSSWEDGINDMGDYRSLSEAQEESEETESAEIPETRSLSMLDNSDSENDPREKTMDDFDPSRLDVDNFTNMTFQDIHDLVTKFPWEVTDFLWQNFSEENI